MLLMYHFSWSKQHDWCLLIQGFPEAGDLLASNCPGDRNGRFWNGRKRKKKEAANFFFTLTLWKFDLWLIWDVFLFFFNFVFCFPNCTFFSYFRLCVPFNVNQYAATLQWSHIQFGHLLPSGDIHAILQCAYCILYVILGKFHIDFAIYVFFFYFLGPYSIQNNLFAIISSGLVAKSKMVDSIEK